MIYKINEEYDLMFSNNNKFQVISDLKQTIDSLYAVVCESEKAVKEVSRSNVELVNSSEKIKRKLDVDTLGDDFTIEAPEQVETPEAILVPTAAFFVSAAGQELCKLSSVS